MSTNTLIPRFVFIYIYMHRKVFCRKECEKPNRDSVLVSVVCQNLRLTEALGF